MAKGSIFALKFLDSGLNVIGILAMIQDLDRFLTEKIVKKKWYTFQNTRDVGYKEIEKKE